MISIHAPHARSDYMTAGTAAALGIISIHAPHARSDALPAHRRREDGDFNPRSSCEERQAGDAKDFSHRKFQSTLLMRGATRTVSRWSRGFGRFQSTLLMRGATKELDEMAEIDRFQSTLLMRGATYAPDCPAALKCISIHAPHARSDFLVPPFDQ